MKQGFGLVTAALVALAMGGCSNSDDAMFVARLSGANEVPPVGSPGSGTVGFSVQGNTVHYSMSVTGIEGVIGAHIHSGNASTNGPIRVVLFPGPSQPPFTDPSGPLDGYLASGSFTASDVDGITLEALLDEMRSGQAYINVHSARFPSPGDVRGQIEPVQ